VIGVKNIPIEDPKITEAIMIAAASYMYKRITLKEVNPTERNTPNSQEFSFTLAVNESHSTKKHRIIDKTPTGGK
jgi:hypothetical protein